MNLAAYPYIHNLSKQRALLQSLVGQPTIHHAAYSQPWSRGADTTAQVRTSYGPKWGPSDAEPLILGGPNCPFRKGTDPLTSIGGDTCKCALDESATFLKTRVNAFFEMRCPLRQSGPFEEIRDPPLLAFVRKRMRYIQQPTINGTNRFIRPLRAGPNLFQYYIQASWRTPVNKINKLRGFALKVVLITAATVYDETTEM